MTKLEAAYLPEPVQSRGDGLALNCPTCLSKLTESPSELRCAACAKAYPRSEGIADVRLGRKDYYFNPVPRPQMAEIIADVDPQHWPRAVRRFIKEVKFNRDWIDNLVVDGRYAWKLFLELPAGARVLDLGCGLGNLTKNIAPHVGEVYALDLTWERLQFARRRFAVFNSEDKISLVAGGDGAHLPFADGTFDCVMLSGVLEWVADDDTPWADVPNKLARLWKMLKAHFGSTNPRAVQRRFLQEIHRVLKPSGQVFIGIENRLDYEYFSGMPDHHSAVPYTSLLPRPAATLYSLAKARVPYRTYTYAYPGYRRLLKDAGFQGSRFLGLTPGYSHLSEIIPYDDARGRWLPRRTANLKDRIKTSMLCVPAYGIIGSKSGEAPAASLMERIAQDVERQSGQLETSLQFSTMRITGRAKAIVRGRLAQREVVLRIPLNDGAVQSERANHDALIEIARRGGALAPSAPAPIVAGAMQNVRYFLEATVPGTQIDAMIRDGRRDHDIEAVAGLLGDMNPRLSEGGLVRLEGGLLARQIDEPLKRIVACVEDIELVAAARTALATLLSGAQLRLGLTHGDFNPENILMADGAVSGVIDWEHWSPEGLPLLDAINFVDGTLRVLDPNRTVADSIKLMIDEQGLPGSYRSFLEGQYRNAGCDRGRHAGFVYLYWLHHVVKQLDELSFDPRGIECRIRPVLEAIAALR